MKDLHLIWQKKHSGFKRLISDTAQLTDYSSILFAFAIKRPAYAGRLGYSGLMFFRLLYQL
jgi:hypothetical protein